MIISNVPAVMHIMLSFSQQLNALCCVCVDIDKNATMLTSGSRRSTISFPNRFNVKQNNTNDDRQSLIALTADDIHEYVTLRVCDGAR